MQDETMVVLAEYNTITEAEIAKSMLDSAGIWSMIRNEYMSAIYPIGTSFRRFRKLLFYRRDGLTLPPAGFVSARRSGSVIRPSPEN